MPFPTLTGTSLLGEDVQLPVGLPAERTLVLCAFKQHQQAQVDRWIERAVRERVMMTRVECPVRGEISSAVCRSNQALPYSNANQDRVALYRACRRGCPHSSLTPGVRP